MYHPPPFGFGCVYVDAMPEQDEFDKYEVLVMVASEGVLTELEVIEVAIVPFCISSNS